jgi:hypothetical protein
MDTDVPDPASGPGYCRLLYGSRKGPRRTGVRVAQDAGRRRELGALVTLLDELPIRLHLRVVRGLLLFVEIVQSRERADRPGVLGAANAGTARATIKSAVTAINAA